MEKNHYSLLTLVVLGLVTSIVLVSTMFLKLPTATGYVHLGDGVIFATSLALGPLYGIVAGALGSALADIFGGYVVWAPWTLVIKGVAGFIVAKLGYNKDKKKQVFAMVLASIWIIAGYAAGTAVIYSPMAILPEVMGNVVQTGSGVLIGAVLSPVLGKIMSETSLSSKVVKEH
ncbi:MAG TPA: ECF transporter S component [Bacillota bacterium]|nr:ECF transporter S component [Bacillota bacterium]